MGEWIFLWICGLGCVDTVFRSHRFGMGHHSTYQFFMAYSGWLKPTKGKNYGFFLGHTNRIPFLPYVVKKEGEPLLAPPNPASITLFL